MRAAAEDHSLAVRRHPIIAQHAACIGQGAAFRNQRRGEIRRQFLGGDDVARERHHAAFQLRRDVAGIAVGGDDHFVQRRTESTREVVTFQPSSRWVMR